MALFTIWIDADSCPSLVRNHAIKIAYKLKLNIILVANKNIHCETDFPYEMKICSAQKDAADDYILENVTNNDLVITRDIVFASKLVQKNITSINDRGTVFNTENIPKLLSERNFNLQLAEIGLVKHFNSGYDKKMFSLFANTFDREINRLLRNYKK